MSVAGKDRPIILVVTGADDATADLVIAELNRRGSCEVARVDPGDFPRHVAMAASLDSESGRWDGLLTTPDGQVDLARVMSIYWRRPTPHTFPGLDVQEAEFARVQAREGFGGVLASLTSCRYVNHPHANWVADYKPRQLSVAAELGLAVPPTLITSDLAAARSFALKHEPIIYKPLRVTALKRDGQPHAIWTQRIETDDLDEGVAGTAHLFQAEVAGKVADLRITVIGQRVFCVRIESATKRLDWRTDYDGLSYQAVQPPHGLVGRLHAYLRRFGLAFGCFDFAVDPSGTPHFLECNPNGQWAWLEPPTGLSLTATFADMLEG